MNYRVITRPAGLVCEILRGENVVAKTSWGIRNTWPLRPLVSFGEIYFLETKTCDWGTWLLKHAVHDLRVCKVSSVIADIYPSQIPIFEQVGFMKYQNPRYQPWNQKGNKLVFIKNL